MLSDMDWRTFDIVPVEHLREINVEVKWYPTETEKLSQLAGYRRYVQFRRTTDPILLQVHNFHPLSWRVLDIIPVTEVSNLPVRMAMYPEADRLGELPIFHERYMWQRNIREKEDVKLMQWKELVLEIEELRRGIRHEKCLYAKLAATHG